MEIKIAKKNEEVESFKDIIIVVDFFRFSTTINALVSKRKKIFVFADENKAIDFYNQNKKFSFFSEKDLNIRKFDNSPYLSLSEKINSNVIVVTNSGSKAVLASKNAYKIIISSLCNITKTKEFILKNNRKVLIVPACIFFNRDHVEDFYASEFLKNFFENKKTDLKELKEKIINAKRIEELKKLRKTAEEDIKIIFSVDLFNTLPVAKILGDFAEVFDEKSDN
ncbi:MAG: 2-phosphosulfolactate phosphatase [Elusimicrobiota bacterium]